MLPMSVFAPSRAKLALYLDLIRWNRPAGWLLLLWPTLTALWLAAGGFPGWHLLIVFVLGTILMRSAGCCINDVADRDFDKYVARTQNRPVTSGRIGTREALAVGAVLAALAFALVLTCNALTVLWSLGALLVAVAYPYAKRLVAMPQAVLGVAFSLGIPMAFAAVNGFIDWSLVGWLVLANILWVLAYDTEYAMVDRADDLKLGIKTSAITLGRFDVAAIAAFYLAHTAIMAYVFIVFWLIQPVKPAWTAMYLIVFAAVLVVLAQVAWHLKLIRKRERADCFRAFSQNHWLGLTWLLTAVALGWFAG